MSNLSCSLLVRPIMGVGAPISVDSKYDTSRIAAGLFIFTPYKAFLLAKRPILLYSRLKPRQYADFCQGVYHSITERVNRDDFSCVCACQSAGGSGVLAEHLGRLCLGALTQRCPLVIDLCWAFAQCLSDDALVQQADGWRNILRLDIAHSVIVNPLVPLAAARQCSGGPTEQARHRNARRTRYPVEELGHQGF